MQNSERVSIMYNTGLSSTEKKIKRLYHRFSYKHSVHWLYYNITLLVFIVLAVLGKTKHTLINCSKVKSVNMYWIIAGGSHKLKWPVIVT